MASPAAVGFLAFVLTVLLVAVPGLLLLPYSMQTYVILGAVGAGGLIAWLATVASYLSLPKAFRNLVKAKSTGLLLIAIGQDKKIRLLPAKSDGFVVRPLEKPYSEKYEFSSDGEGVYPVHQGKGVQAAVVYMGYPFTLAGDKMAAISKFREMGFKTIDDLKLAVELYESGEVEGRIRQLEDLKSQLAAMSDADVQKQFNASREEVLQEVEAELERLRNIKRVVEESGGPSKLRAYIDGAVVKARDLVNYLVWRHHPSELRRIIISETNAYVSRLTPLDWIKQWAPLLILAGIIIIGLVAALNILSGPPEVNVIVPQNLTQPAHTATQTGGLTKWLPGGG